MPRMPLSLTIVKRLSKLIIIYPSNSFAADTDTHTDTNRFMAFLDFVQDYPREPAPAPER